MRAAAYRKHTQLGYGYAAAVAAIHSCAVTERASSRGCIFRPLVLRCERLSGIQGRPYSCRGSGASWPLAAAYQAAASGALAMAVGLAGGIGGGLLFSAPAGCARLPGNWAVLVPGPGGVAPLARDFQAWHWPSRYALGLVIMARAQQWSAHR